MSRAIDMDNLTQDDLIWLADRGRLPAGERDPRVRPQAGDLSNVPNVGDVGIIVSDTPDEPIFSMYEDMTVTELKDELDRRGLDTSGKKADLVARLEASD